MARAKSSAKSEFIPIERIAASIYLIRGQKVMLDSDAALYSVDTKVFNQAVRRNIDRFPEDFMFQFTPEEAATRRSQIVTLEKGRGHYPKYAPLAFTVAIMRTFVRLRQVLVTNEELAQTVAKHDRQIAILFENVRKMLAPPAVKRNQIGFVAPKD